MFTERDHLNPLEDQLAKALDIRLKYFLSIPLEDDDDPDALSHLWDPEFWDKLKESRRGKTEPCSRKEKT